MKIRSDFVTNSSSSSYSVIFMTMNDGKYLYWQGGYERESPLFDFPADVTAKLNALQDVDSLVEFLYECSRIAGAEKIFQEECSDFIEKVQQIQSIDDIDYLEMNWGMYLTDQGEDPDEGCQGFQLTYYFESGECDYSLDPPQDFIDEMNNLYG